MTLTLRSRLTLIYAAVVGGWWGHFSGVGSHENYAAMFAALVMMMHALGFVGPGMFLLLFPQLRSSGIQLLLGYGVLLSSWLVGTLVAL